MTTFARWTPAAAVVALPMMLLLHLNGPLAPAHAQRISRATTPLAKPRPAAAARARRTPPKPPAAASNEELPPRTPFTAAEGAASVIAGMPDARFWADSETDFTNALPGEPGPWLILSSGGADGAFGAGLLNGLTAAGKRPDYAVVTGVSTGALIAPFAFAGSRYDQALRDAYTKVTAADIFEAGSTSESFVDSWPLKEFIAKEITPALLRDIAAEHRRGRRLFVTSYNLDAERAVVWNMGAIAAHGSEDALKLFRSVLLASTSIPGGFPPVLIEVQANGKRFQEMHVDGGVGGQLFVAPPPLMASTSDYRLPATQLYIVVNTRLEPDFKVVERFAPSILTQTVDAAVKVDTRIMIDRAYLLAKRSEVGFSIATIPSTFNAPSQGAFDPKYMAALFAAGYDEGRSATPFSSEPPPYPQAPAAQSSDEKTGANQ